MPRGARSGGAEDGEGARREPPLKREAAGRYLTRDGRFIVEQSSGRWILLDNDQADELGLPLVRGPFPTLDDVREAIAGARTDAAPASVLTDQTPGKPSSPARPSARDTRPGKPPPPPPPVVVREYRSTDADALRSLWEVAGLLRAGSDDARSLDAFARRNPGLALVAVQDRRIVGSALGAWDGRHGWIYHVATAPDHRRAGVATRLVRELEGRLRDLGCRDANVNVGADDEGARRFWESLGYPEQPTRRHRRQLEAD